MKNRMKDYARSFSIGFIAGAGCYLGQILVSAIVNKIYGITNKDLNSVNDEEPSD